MNDIAFWEKYEKYKTWDSKSRFIRELFYTNNISSLDRVSKEILQSSSINLKAEAIKVISVLEEKFTQDPQLNNQEHYKKLLAKYKLKNVRNFWFKDYKQIKNQNILDYFEKEIQKRYDNGIKGSFKLEAKFLLGPHLTGFSFLNIGRQNSYEFSHITYGFFSDLVDYNGKMLNNLPTTHIHLQQIPTVPYEILCLNNNTFNFNEILKKEIENFFTFFKTHYEQLNLVEPSEFNTSKYINSTKKLSEDNSGLWTILAMMNIAKNENRKDRLVELAGIGKSILGNKFSGSAWIEYFDKYYK
jgi:hypothetical protein